MNQLVFEVIIKHEQLVTTLTCRGRLDPSAARRLDEAVDVALETCPTELEVQTTSVVRIGFAGVLSLLRAGRCCERRGVHFRLDAGAVVSDALEISGLWWLGIAPPPNGLSDEVERWLQRHAFAELGRHLFARGTDEDLMGSPEGT